MENLRKGLSDMLSLIVAKENGEYYTWSEVAIDLLIVAFLLSACFLVSIAR